MLAEGPHLYLHTLRDRIAPRDMQDDLVRRAHPRQHPDRVLGLIILFLASSFAVYACFGTLKCDTPPRCCGSGLNEYIKIDAHCLQCALEFNFKCKKIE